MAQRLYWGLNLGETSGFLTMNALVADRCDQRANKEVERNVYMCIQVYVIMDIQAKELSRTDNQNGMDIKASISEK